MPLVRPAERTGSGVPALPRAPAVSRTARPGPLLRLKAGLSWSRAMHTRRPAPAVAFNRGGRWPVVTERAVTTGAAWADGAVSIDMRSPDRESSRSRFLRHAPCRRVQRESSRVSQCFGGVLVYGVAPRAGFGGGGARSLGAAGRWGIGRTDAQDAAPCGARGVESRSCSVRLLAARRSGIERLKTRRENDQNPALLKVRVPPCAVATGAFVLHRAC